LSSTEEIWRGVKLLDEAYESVSWLVEGQHDIILMLATGKYEKEDYKEYATTLEGWNWLWQKEYDCWGHF